MTARFPNVKDCIAYIESCGWRLLYFNAPWYVFKATGTARTWNGSDEITFTLAEIRHAKAFGW